MKQPPKMFLPNTGDIIYFKGAQNRPHRKADGCAFKGYGIGLFLGHVIPFQKAPDQHDALRLIGACGFISFDEILEFLGDEQAQLCIQKFEEKYYVNGKAAPEVVGPDGKPVPVLSSEDVQKQMQNIAPEKIQEAIDNARKDTEAKLRRPLTEDEEKEVKTKVCAVLGLDPATLRPKLTILGVDQAAPNEDESPFPKSSLPIAEN